MGQIDDREFCENCPLVSCDSLCTAIMVSMDYSQDCVLAGGKDCLCDNECELIKDDPLIK